MPVPTNLEKRQHKNFILRQRRHEALYTPQFLKYLDGVYNSYSTAIDTFGPNYVLSNINKFLDEKELIRIYKKLYTNITYDEVKEEDRLLGLNQGQKMLTKDLIDDLAKQLPYSSGDRLKAIRDLITRYISERIGQRIVEVSITTVKRVSKIIQDSINQGLGAREIAKQIEDAKKINANRALVIARTETVSSMNQGKYISALSSPFEMVKRWMPTGDERTRHSHLIFWDSEFIDMDDFFTVERTKPGAAADLARFPGDDTLSAENVIQCRCAVSFKIKLGPNGRPIRKVLN